MLELVVAVVAITVGVFWYLRLFFAIVMWVLSSIVLWILDLWILDDNG